MRLSIGIVIALLSTAAVSAKVLVMTYAYNRPEFIEIQYRTLQKFLKGDYEFVVYNDAKDTALAKSIENMCKRYSIRCVRIPQQIHTKPYLTRWPGENYQAPAVRNVNVVMYSLHQEGFAHDGIVVLLDSDMFLVKEFDIEKYMEGYDIAALMSGDKYSYLWIGLVFMDMRSMPNKDTINFNCGRVLDHPVDAGGHTYYYLRDNPSVRLHEIGTLHTDALQGYNHVLIDDLFADETTRKFLKKEPQNVEFLLQGTFFHYRGGTNWDNKSSTYHMHKATLVKEYIADLLSV